MARLATTEIKESIEELVKIRKSQTSLKQEKRVECLILLKGNRFKSQKAVAEYLKVSLKTIDRWLRIYRNEGIKGLTSAMTRNKPSKLITPEVHTALKAKLEDSQSPLLGYWQAKQWLMDTHQVAINYHWLRKYLIKHFKTKLKSPRKSHLNKDPQAKEAFFKTAPHLRIT